MWFFVVILCINMDIFLIICHKFVWNFYKFFLLSVLNILMSYLQLWLTFSRSYCSTYKECNGSTISSFLIAFISVYNHFHTGNQYFHKAILFHFASEWTISNFSRDFSNDTHFSVPLKSSCNQVSDLTNNGAQTLIKSNSLSKIFSNVCFVSAIAVIFFK